MEKIRSAHGELPYRRDRRREQMKKVMVAFYSRTGKTEQMAEAIAEGVRFSGNAAEVVKIADIKSEKEFQGFEVTV